MEKKAKHPRTSEEPKPASADHTTCELYSLTFDSIHDGVFTIDSAYRITSFNSSAERITGVPREQAIGKKCYEVFRASVCQSDCALKRTLKTGRPLRRMRIDILDASMHTVPIEVSTAVLREGDQWVGGVEIFRDISETEALRQELRGGQQFRNIVGASQPMQDLFRTLPDVAQSEAPVLIEGPSGTGKELVAQAVHELSGRRDKPFIKLNCAALPDSLLESELFGFEKGAFTDARRDKPGRFLLADHGTIFLDEIGDISSAFQAKLLRVLQEGEVQPLGSTRTLKIDARLVTATNKDLKSLVTEGKFREDLYYRIRVVPLILPPLRARRSDIALLVDHFLHKLSARTGKTINAVSDAAMAVLQAYDYPGNIRELENALHRAFVLSRGPEIDVEHLPQEWALSEPGPKEEAAMDPRVDALLPRVTTPERDELVRVLEANKWNRTAAARFLGIARNTLWRKMKASGIEG